MSALNEINKLTARTTPTKTVLPTRILSIQSSVVYGICGNKAAMFPLQLHGYDVSPINTVQLSNHTYYPSWTGTTTNKEQINELIHGLINNRLLSFHYLLTGYMGSESSLQSLPNIITSLKENSTNFFYACDPVMGDNGQLYSETFLPFIDIYRNEVIPHATLLTPNQTETQLLLNMNVNTVNDAYVACVKFHEIGIRYLVITSVDEIVDGEEYITIVFSDAKYNEFYVLRVKKIGGHYCGTGDLTTALLLAWIIKYPDNFLMVVENTMNCMQAIIMRTMKCKSKEIVLFGSGPCGDILEPEIVYKATEIVPSHTLNKL